MFLKHCPFFSEVSELPIRKLAYMAGYSGPSGTEDFLRAWFDDVIEFVAPHRIDYLGDLYDTPELQHILSLAQRTRFVLAVYIPFFILIFQAQKSSRTKDFWWWKR